MITIIWHYIITSCFTVLSFIICLPLWMPSGRLVDKYIHKTLISAYNYIILFHKPKDTKRLQSQSVHLPAVLPADYEAASFPTTDLVLNSLSLIVHFYDLIIICIALCIFVCACVCSFGNCKWNVTTQACVAYWHLSKSWVLKTCVSIYG